MARLSRPRLTRALTVAVPLLAGVGLVGVDLLGLLPRPTILRAGFAVAGGLVALLIYTASSGDGPDVPSRVPAPLVTKVVLLLAAGGVVATALLDARVLVFAVVLPLGLALVVLQLRAEPSVPAILTQLGALFLAGRLGKYLTTGFYFGGSDTFAHVAAVDTLLRTRTTASIPHGYDLYPVFHLLVGAVEHATALPSYDALVLTGAALLTLVSPLAYLLGWSVFGFEYLGLLAALSVTVLEFFSYHALYFYPQALASVLLLVGLYLNSRLRTTADERTFRRLSVFVVLLLLTMVVTHHLTYVLFALVAAVAVPIALARPWLFGESPAGGRRRFSYRWMFPAVLGAVFLLAYWSYSPSLITVGIVTLSLGVLFDVAALPVQQLFTYGAVLPVDTVGRAVEWLVTPTGVYAAGFASLLLLAGYELLENLRSYSRGFTLAATGLLLSALLLPLPIPIPQVERLRFVVTLVAIFPVAIGLRRVLAVDRRYLAAAVVLVAAVGGATALTVLVADDVPGVYIDEPGEQVAMSENQFRAVGSTADFLARYGTGPAASDSLTNRAFEVARFDDTDPLVAHSDGLRTDGDYLVVRERWSDHLVRLGTGVLSRESSTIAVSPSRFTATDATLRTVYSSGHTRIYHSSDGFRGVYGTGPG